MDKTDKAILARLQADAALSVGDLAEIVGISKSACWRRIQKLEQGGVIRGRVTLLDAAALDLSLTVFISIKTNQHNEQWARQFKTVVEGIPGILEVYRMGGEADYLLKAIVQEIVDRKGWSNGSPMAFGFIKDDNSTKLGRRAAAFDISPSNAPVLHGEVLPAEATKYYGYFNPDYFYEYINTQNE